MPKMNVNKSIQINAPINEVYNKLNDFHHWEVWSPWLITDKSARVNVNEDGKYYSWQGERVGEGNMKVIAEKEGEINYDLHFLKPWKSQADVGFKLTPKGEGTEVTWSMESKIPLFLFWMKKSMTAFVGMDYERGLRMLKDYVEEGKVHSDLDFKGNKPIDGFKYIGIKRSCKIANMGVDMGQQFTKLGTFVKENNINPEGDTLSIYHKWDMVAGTAEYTAAIPVKEIPANLSNGFITGEIPKTNVHAVAHTGKYEHLGNAWTAQYGMQRAKVFKSNKKLDPMEVYKNDPTKTPANELVTEILFPVV